MHLELWFPQPIWFKDYAVDFSEAIDYIHKLKESSPGRKLTNIGGWQSEDVELAETKELEEPFGVIRRGVEFVVGSLQEKGFGHFRLSNTWINVNNGTNFNREHVHPGATLSGCLYLQVSEKSGDIVFNRPDDMNLFPGMGGLHTEDMFFTSTNYKPTTGRLLIFPAWIPHMVLPSEEGEERISIAFNLIHEGK